MSLALSVGLVVVGKLGYRSMLYPVPNRMLDGPPEGAQLPDGAE